MDLGLVGAYKEAHSYTFIWTQERTLKAGPTVSVDGWAEAEADGRNIVSYKHDHYHTAHRCYFNFWNYIELSLLRTPLHSCFS